MGILFLLFLFLLGITAIPREIEINAYAKFWGANIRFIMGNVAVAYRSENTGIGLFSGDHKILLFITQVLKYHMDELYYICS